MKIWYCSHSFRSCACTCSLAEFLTRQFCNRTIAGLWLDKMRCTVGMEFWIPTGLTFWLTTLDCLDRVGSVPIQSTKSVAWSLHRQCLVLGTVSEVKTWRKDLWTFAGGNTSRNVCCFKLTCFTFLLLLLSVLIRGIQWVCAELSPSSEKNCCTGQSTFCKRAQAISRRNPLGSPVTLRSKCDHREPQVKSAALTGSDTVSRLGVYVDQGSLSSDSLTWGPIHVWHNVIILEEGWPICVSIHRSRVYCAYCTEIHICVCSSRYTTRNVS